MRGSFLLSALDGLPSPILIGLSGGLDSCALLHALLAAGKKPVVLHFDHGWRPESAADALWVAELAARHALPFITGKAAKGKRSEAEARRQRWAFFAKAARQTGIPELVLAHHADDQAETFLLQLLRGTGSAWAGMAARSTREGMTVHRPWLGIWREEIEAYARKERLKWREDASNSDPRFLRNRIRGQLLPLLEKEYAPSLRGRLHQTAEIQRAENEWMESLIAEAAAPKRLPVALLAGGPIGWQRRLLRRWLENRGMTGLSFETIEAARMLLQKTSPAKVNLSKGYYLRRRTGFLFLE